MWESWKSETLAGQRFPRIVRVLSWHHYNIRDAPIQSRIPLENRAPARFFCISASEGIRLLRKYRGGISGGISSAAGNWSLFPFRHIHRPGYADTPQARSATRQSGRVTVGPVLAAEDARHSDPHLQGHARRPRAPAAARRWRSPQALRTAGQQTHPCRKTVPIRARRGRARTPRRQ